VKGINDRRKHVKVEDLCELTNFVKEKWESKQCMSTKWIKRYSNWKLKLREKHILYWHMTDFSYISHFKQILSTNQII
jgi:hypothetical protein